MERGRGWDEDDDDVAVVDGKGMIDWLTIGVEVALEKYRNVVDLNPYPSRLLLLAHRREERRER